MEKNKYLKFEIEGCIFAIPIENVHEITNYIAPQRLLGRIEPYIEGIVNFRGNTAIVCNLKKYFDFCNTETTKKMIFVSIKNKMVAIMVDRVIGITVAEDSQIDKNLAWQIFMEDEAITGILKDSQSLVAILNIEQILNRQDYEYKLSR